MPYRLTRHAEAHLIGIFRWSYKSFGLRQAERYRDALKSCCERLADNPEMGRPVGARRGLRRQEHGSNVLFYREDERGILLVAILHRRRLPDLDAL